MKPAFTYAAIYLLIFNLFFLERISESNQTSNVFVETSIMMVAIVIALYLVLKRVLKESNWVDGILTEGALLFFLSELTAFCFFGEICFFGILVKGNNHLIAYPNNLKFREERDFSFSMSFLLAAILFVCLKALYRRFRVLS